MDFFSAQKFFADMFPGKKISYTFDQSCVRQLECVMTDGLPNVLHHIEFNKVKVDVENMSSQYVPIDAHRANISWASFKTVISDINDVFVTDNYLNVFTIESTPEEKVQARQDLKNLTGLSDELINDKIQKAQNEAINGKPDEPEAPPVKVEL